MGGCLDTENESLNNWEIQINKEVGTADQQERGTATQQPITRICSPGVVELVRSNLAPDFPLFHAADTALH